MSDEIKKSSFFVELDVLFDTRIATLTQNDNDVHLKVINPDYFNRHAEVFNGYDYTTFSKLYEKRDKSIFEFAVITKLAEIITKFADTTILNTVKTPFHAVPKVIVNTYPYDLKEEELDNIARGIRAITRGNADVEMVNVSYEEITPAYLNKNISIISIYQYNKWLDAQAALGNFDKVACPSVTMFSPAVIFKDSPMFVDDVNKLFNDVEQITRPFINLQLLPIRYFCLIFQPEEK